jgi:hypothetical protein
MKSSTTFALAFASLLAQVATARADLTTHAAPTEQPYHHAVSLQLMTLDRTGLAIQGDRDLGWKKLSIALAVGGRTAASGEFGSSTLGAGVELRRWLLRPTTMNGWYVAARTDLARTSIEDMVDDRDIGSLVTWSVGASTGYRFVIRDRVEITPSIGTALVVEGGLDGMSPATARGAATIGLTAGVTF